MYFGLALPYARMVRGYADTGTSLMRDNIQRNTRLMTMASILTLVFGLAAFLMRGWATNVSAFALFGMEYHTSMLLIFVLVVIQIVLVQGTWNKLQSQVADGVDPSASVKRISMATGINHLIWVIVLVLMFWPKLSGSINTAM